MGNSNSSSCTLCKSYSCCVVANNKKGNSNQQKVVELVNSSDGKLVTTFTSPILVKDALARLSGVKYSGIGLSNEADSESLRPDYELEIGRVYYVLPCVKRVKVVITKQQLKELLAKQISFEEVLLGLKKNMKPSLDDDRFSANRKSSLESIPEEIE